MEHLTTAWIRGPEKGVTFMNTYANSSLRPLQRTVTHHVWVWGILLLIMQVIAAKVGVSVFLGLGAEA